MNFNQYPTDFRKNHYDMLAKKLALRRAFEKERAEVAHLSSWDQSKVLEMSRAADKMLAKFN